MMPEFIDFRIISLIIGYAFGMIQTSYIVGRMSGIDIRDHGSKNAGFTNTNRVLGFKKGVIVFVIDVLKSMAAFAIVTIIYSDINAGGTFFSTNYVTPGLYAGLGAILGHCFPFYLKFKGGKGVSSMIGLIIMLDLRVIIVALIIGITTAAVTRFISLASMLTALSVAISMLVFSYPPEDVGLTAALCVFIWFLHRQNIKRLLSGTENKFSFKNKVNPPADTVNLQK